MPYKLPVKTLTRKHLIFLCCCIASDISNMHEPVSAFKVWNFDIRRFVEFYFKLPCYTCQLSRQRISRQFKPTDEYLSPNWKNFSWYSLNWPTVEKYINSNQRREREVHVKDATSCKIFQIQKGKVLATRIRLAKHVFGLGPKNVWSVVENLRTSSVMVWLSLKILTFQG